MHCFRGPLALRDQIRRVANENGIALEQAWLRVVQAGLKAQERPQEGRSTEAAPDPAEAA